MKCFEHLIYEKQFYKKIKSGKIYGTNTVFDRIQMLLLIKESCNTKAKTLDFF